MLTPYHLKPHEIVRLTHIISVNKIFIIWTSWVKSPQILPVCRLSDVEEIVFQKFAHLYWKIPLLQVIFSTFRLFFRRYLNNSIFLHCGIILILDKYFYTQVNENSFFIDQTQFNINLNLKIKKKINRNILINTIIYSWSN